MHDTKRPSSHIRIPNRWEEEETLLADIAYFNSHVCKTGHFYSQHVVSKSLGRKKGRTHESGRELANTPAFSHAQRQRKKVEALFAELKNQIGLRRLRLRRLKFVREQFFLAAAAQNIKRLVRFLSQPTTPPMEAAT